VLRFWEHEDPSDVSLQILKAVASNDQSSGCD